MEPYSLSAIVTVCNSIFIIYLAVNVGLTRMRNKAPAYKITKDEKINIANRAHMNTIENTVVFMPLLWMATIFSSATIAGMFGLVWLLARIWYAFAYLQDPSSRSNPFFLSIACIVCTILLVIYGIVL